MVALFRSIKVALRGICHASEQSHVYQKNTVTDLQVLFAAAQFAFTRYRHRRVSSATLVLNAIGYLIHIVVGRVFFSHSESPLGSMAMSGRSFAYAYVLIPPLSPIGSLSI